MDKIKFYTDELNKMYENTLNEINSLLIEKFPDNKNSFEYNDLSYDSYKTKKIYLKIYFNEYDYIYVFLDKHLKICINFNTSKFFENGKTNSPYLNVISIVEDKSLLQKMYEILIAYNTYYKIINNKIKEYKEAIEKNELRKILKDKYYRISAIKKNFSEDNIKDKYAVILPAEKIIDADVIYRKKYFKLIYDFPMTFREIMDKQKKIIKNSKTVDASKIHFIIENHPD